MHYFRYILVVFLAISPSAYADLASYRAEYVAEYQGLPVRARGVREFSSLGNDRFQLVSSATSLFVKLTESTRFEKLDGKLMPLSYSYVRKGMGKNKQENLDFDWQQMQLHHEGTTSELTADTLDKLSYQFQLQSDVADAVSAGLTDTILSYQIADEEKRKIYRFRISGEETLETPIGDLRTVKVERLRDDDERQTIFWLAADHSFLLVRLVQVEKDRGFELNLSNATINGQPL